MPLANLPALVKAKRINRRVVLRPIVATKAQERELARIYLRAITLWSEACRDRILPSYARTLSEMQTDSIADVNFEITATEGEAVRASFSWSGLFRSFFQKFSEWHLSKFISGLKYQTDVNLETVMTGREPATQDTLEIILNRNTSLIRSVSDQARQRIADAVLRGLQNRTPVRDVAKEIQEALGMGSKRARLIAQDQIQKINRALDTQRANEVGLFDWEWQHSRKQHFRPAHKARDGKKYSDENLPDELKGDLPGERPWCGCLKRYFVE